MKIVNKITEILNSAWFNAAAVGTAGALVFMYGYKLYAGILFGWAASNAYKWMKSLKK
jgi:hypothetical protein